MRSSKPAFILLQLKCSERFHGQHLSLDLLIYRKAHKGFLIIANVRAIAKVVAVEFAEIFHTCVSVFLVFRSELRCDRVGDFDDDHFLIPLR